MSGMARGGHCMMLCPASPLRYASSKSGCSSMRSRSDARHMRANCQERSEWGWEGLVWYEADNQEMDTSVGMYVCLSDGRSIDRSIGKPYLP